MSCSAFERWLDDGRPGDGRAAAELHASRCDACARRQRDMDRIEELLGGRFATAPAAFVDRVMADLPARRARLPVPEPEFPWWVRIFQEPMVVASLAGATGLMAALPELERHATDLMPHARTLVERGVLGLDALTAASFASSLIAPGILVLVAAVGPLLLRAAAAVAGDPSPDGDL